MSFYQIPTLPPTAAAIAIVQAAKTAGVKYLYNGIHKIKCGYTQYGTRCTIIIKPTETGCRFLHIGTRDIRKEFTYGDMTEMITNYETRHDGGLVHLNKYMTINNNGHIEIFDCGEVIRKIFLYILDLDAPIETLARQCDLVRGGWIGTKWTLSDVDSQSSISVSKCDDHFIIGISVGPTTTSVMVSKENMSKIESSPGWRGPPTETPTVYLQPCELGIRCGPASVRFELSWSGYRLLRATLKSLV